MIFKSSLPNVSSVAKSVLCSICAVVVFNAGAGKADALTLQDAILFVLETNPEIKAAESNKQAIEFELEQARNFYAPNVSFEAWVGTSENRGTATPDLGSAPGSVEGFELRARVSQMLFDGFRTRSEIERQAYRIDGAAYRVLERSEVLSLEAVRLYSDVLRTQALLSLAQRNLTYHREVYGRLKTGFDRGVVGIGDLQQAEERVFLAEDIILEFQLNLEDARTLFLETVGVEAKSLQTLPSIARATPGSLELAIARARSDNPTIRFMQADVGSAEALARRANSNQYPTLHLEAEGRTGEDVGGFFGDRDDFSVGLIMRYEFQGTRKRAVRQEQARRVNESKSHLLGHTRRVESEVRQSWSTLRSAKRRLTTIQSQANLSRKLREAYESEYLVGNRSLLDVLNTQSALFQAEANLINARSLATYVEYRLLASIGVLLPTLGLEPPEDAKPYARDQVGAPGLSETSSERQFDASSFKNWRKSIDK